MFALLTILITLATWKAALMYYAREIKVLERNVAVLEDRIPTEATTVKAPIEVDREQTTKAFLAACSDPQRALLKWLLDRDDAIVEDMHAIDNPSEFLRSAFERD